MEKLITLDNLETYHDEFNSNLKTINNSSIIGKGNIEIDAKLSTELNKAYLNYYRYVGEKSSEAAEYTNNIRNATLDMEEFAKLGTGLFIHWGVYSVPAGTYTGEKVPTATMTTTKLTRNTEWSLRDLGIPLDVYKDYETQFTGNNFNATEIVNLAKQCGMKYIVITAKHHEGFSLYPTQYGDWDIRTSACRNTVLDELKQACAAADIKFGLYYSQYWDWEAIGGYGLNHGNKWTTTDPYTQEQHNSFIEKVGNQINEMVEKYEPYLIWYDPGTNYTDGCVAKLRESEKQYPQIITNDRLAYDRSYGDYGTGERTIYIKDKLKYGESCFTLNNTWGYSENNETESWYYSPEKLLKNYLLYTLSYGQNCLMNVGPKADGSLSDLTLERLNSIKSFITDYANGGFYNYKKMFKTTRPNWGYMIGLPNNEVICYIIPSSDDNISNFILDGVDTTMLSENGVEILTHDTECSYEILDNYRIRIIGMTLDTVSKIGVIKLKYSDTPMILDMTCASEDNKISTSIFPVNSSTYTLYDLNKDSNSSPTTQRIYNFKANANKTLSNARMRWCGNDGYYSVRTLANYSANQAGTIITNITLVNEDDSSDTTTLTINCPSRSKIVKESTDVVYLKNGNTYKVSYNVNGTDTNEFSQTGFSFFLNESASVTGVELNPTSKTFGLGETATFEAIVSPANAADKSVTWSCDEPRITLVENEGTVTLSSTTYEDFDATLTVTTNDGGFIATSNIEYRNIHPETISLSQSEATLIKNSLDVLQLTATILPEASVEKTVTWTTSDVTVATVVNGLVSTLNPGTATITATTLDGNLSDNCTIIVQDSERIPVDSITLNKTSLDVQECQISEITATISPENATYQDITWESNNENVIVKPKVDDPKTVEIVAKEGFSGTVEITATSTDPSHASAVANMNVSLETNDYLFEVESLDGTDSVVLQDTGITPFTDDYLNWTIFSWAYGSAANAPTTNATLYQCVKNASSWNGLRVDADNNSTSITSGKPVGLRPRVNITTNVYTNPATGVSGASGINSTIPSDGSLITIHPYYFSRQTEEGKAWNESTYWYSLDGENWTQYTASTSTSGGVGELRNIAAPLTVGYDYKRASGQLTTERYRFLNTTGLADERACVLMKNEAKYKFAKHLKNYDKDIKDKYNSIVNGGL